MFSKSIRTRIQIWHTTLLSCLTGALLVAFYFHEKEIMERDFDQSIMSEITAAIPQFAPSAPMPDGPPNGQMSGGPPSGPMHEGPPNRSMTGGPPSGPQNHELRGPRGHRAGPIDETPEQALVRQNKEAERLIEKGYYVVSLLRDGTIKFASINAPQHIPAPKIQSREERQPVYMRDNGEYREAIHSAPGGTSVLIGASKDLLIGQFAHLRWVLVLIGGTTTLTGFAVGWLLIGRSLRPIRSISKTAAEIAAGDLSQRINIEDTDTELGQMGKVLNETFSKLESNFDQQIRFTADASHELRTPIAVILAKCQFALRRDRESEKYKDALKTCETSAQHIRNLVESLLELAKVDSGEFQVLTQSGDLKDIAENCVNLLTTLAEEKEIQIDCNIGPAPCRIDRDRIQQVAINLMSNAIKYTAKGGVITIATHTTETTCYFEIQDTGPGIHPQDLPHLFDRFYRVNNERSEDRRSTGLGLAITKAIVTAHGGDIEVSSVLGRGSCFTVKIPIETNNRIQLPEQGSQQSSARRTA